MGRFSGALRQARLAAGLSQRALADHAGVARPNVVAYERGRREPLFDNGVDLLEATGAQVLIEEPVRWTWSDGLRPYAVPSRLWRLNPDIALRRLEIGQPLWWSGPERSFDLARRHERLRAYEILLREGSPTDIEGAVDGLLLLEAWADLVLPRALRDAWSEVLSPAELSR